MQQIQRKTQGCTIEEKLFLNLYRKECTCKYSENKINISIYLQQIQPNKLTKTFPSRISSRERKPLFKPESQSEQASVGKKKSSLLDFTKQTHERNALKGNAAKVRISKEVGKYLYPNLFGYTMVLCRKKRLIYTKMNS